MKFQQIRSATSIVTYNNVRFLVDPMLADKYAWPTIDTAINCAKGNPTTDLPCSVEDLLNVDALLVTHLHFDHFDNVARTIIPKDLPVIVPDDIEADSILTSGFKNVLNAQNTIYFRGIKIAVTECEHGDGDPVVYDIFRNKGIDGRAHGFVLSSENEKGAFYLAGDTVLYKTVFDVIDEFRPFTMAVNAACAQMSPGHSIMMGLDDLRVLCRAKNSLNVIATHLDGVSHATLSSEDIRAYKKLENLNNLHVPAPLETLEF
ncbi:MAG: MBL fold metallo-hydrolase [Succinivibrio sp.]